MSSAFERMQKSNRVGCPFCWEWIPTPQQQFMVFSGDGALGGRCECGVAFIVDETGKGGGQAMLDAQALACDGDLDRAMTLSSGEDFEVQNRPYRGPINTLGGRSGGHSYLTPKVWFVKLKSP